MKTKKKFFGYCMEFTKDDLSIQKQSECLEWFYHNIEIYTDIVDTLYTKREGYQKLCGHITCGDILVVCSILQLGRNIEECIHEYMSHYHNKISIVILDNRSICSEVYNDIFNMDCATVDSHIDKLPLIQAKLSYFTDDLIISQIQMCYTHLVEGTLREKQASVKAATESEQQCGDIVQQPIKVTNIEMAILKYSNRLGGLCTDRDVIEKLRCSGIALSRQTYYKYKSQLFVKLRNTTTHEYLRLLEDTLSHQQSSDMVSSRTFETKKSKSAKQIIIKYSKAFNGTLSDAEVMQMLNINRNSYYKYKSELKNDTKEHIKEYEE